MFKKETKTIYEMMRPDETEKYTFKCKNNSIHAIGLRNLTNQDHAIEAMIKSHLYMAITTQEVNFRRDLPPLPLIIWIDWTIEEIKKHPDTTYAQKIIPIETKQKFSKSMR